MQEIDKLSLKKLASSGTGLGMGLQIEFDLENFQTHQSLSLDKK